MVSNPCSDGIVGLVCHLGHALHDLGSDIVEDSITARSGDSLSHQETHVHLFVGIVFLVAIVLALVGVLLYCCSSGIPLPLQDSRVDTTGSAGNQLAKKTVHRSMDEVDDVAFGQAQESRFGGFAWIRKNNDEISRKSRRAIAEITELALVYRSYTTNVKVPLQFVDAMTSGTRIISPTIGHWLPHTQCIRCPGRQSPKESRTQVRVVSGSLLDVAKDQVESGSRVAVVSAASAYHVGGGFSSGGRHALEESICVQSTLYRSLQHALGLGMKAVLSGSLEVTPRRIASARRRHIPDDGAILSPSVEVFRAGTDSGYAFLRSPWVIPAVISVAMPNNNHDVKDSPVDAQSDPVLYEAQLMSKWRAVLTAAAHFTDVDTLVVPDAGCGVFKNPPGIVGATLGKVLRTEFPTRFDEVLLVFGASSSTGDAFAESVRKTFYC
eukprot:TRINITY_DN63711_c0_g1_i1.p1 TRINITY_DN63711_c0_g1~~TRINITY_DN63711_c0_g1_i1.p1  ORF type:complete len:493 (+),score=65.91 TRINITY_DN63711_c0_g1_i1:166-1479(+)